MLWSTSNTCGRSLPAVAIVGAAMIVAGCESKVSDDSYQQITTGMTLDDVQHILGKGEQDVSGGVGISASGIAGGREDSQATIKTYNWKDGQKMIIIDFREEKVINKRKLGF